MRILHIASISNNPFTGVSVAVPQHVMHQGEFAETALLNITNELIEGVPMQLEYYEKAGLEAIYEPFGKPDIIVFHEAYRVPYLKISRQAQKLGIPYVIVPHGELGEWAQKKKRLKKKVANLLLFNRFIEGAAAIQCLSTSELMGTHFKCKKFIGTNGVEFPSERKLCFRSSKLRFLYIGRLEVRIKGLDLMLEAFANESSLMRETGSTLTIHGPDINGRYRRVEALISELGIDDFVALKHEVLGNDKKRAILDSDVFVQTSRTEGMPMGILEAMSYGLPCLLTEGTSLTRELDRYNAGWTCENNAESIAVAIGNLLNDTTKLEEKGCSARKLVEQNYGWQTVACETAKAYKSIAVKQSSES